MDVDKSLVNFNLYFKSYLSTFFNFKSLEKFNLDFISFPAIFYF